MNKFEDDVDPLFLKAQLQRIRDEQKKHRNAVNPATYNRPKEERRGCGGGLFMVVALAWCLVACGPSRQFKDQAADVLDVARQLHWSGCEEKHVDASCKELLNNSESDCEPYTLLQQDLCDKAYYTLVGAEPGLEDEIAKKRRLQAMWDTIEPVVWPYVESGVLTAAQLLLAYVTGNILGQALETVSKPP